MPRRDDMISKASELEYLEHEQRARFDCMDALDKLVQPAAYDYAPRMQDRWVILHELTDPRNLDNPRVAVVRLETVLAANPSLSTYAKYLSPAIGALNKYAFKLDSIAHKATHRGVTGPAVNNTGVKFGSEGTDSTSAVGAKAPHEPAVA